MIKYTYVFVSAFLRAPGRPVMSAVDGRRQIPPEECVNDAWRGIELCRQGDWQEGLYWLGTAAELTADDSSPGSEALPGLFYAYLGYGVARYQGQQKQGLKLCRRAVDMELYQPEGYYFLARTLLLTDDRRAAIGVIERGLEVDSANDALIALKNQLGERRRAVLAFLPRRHLLNRWLGRIRHALLGPERRGPR